MIWKRSPFDKLRVTRQAQGDTTSSGRHDKLRMTRQAKGDTISPG